jgi:outer membrane protein assembly factor BamB
MMGFRFGQRFARAATVTGLIGMVAFGLAQNFPTFGGNNARQGHNEAPNTSGPGAARLTWFRPSGTDNAGRPLDIDNNDLAVPNTDPAFFTQTGVWNVPALAEEAPGAYLPNTSSATPTLSRSNTPGYVFAEAIASAAGNDPRVPLNPADTLSTFTWTVRTKVAPFYESRDYAIYVWIPTGPTTVGGVQRFPQRYFVYEVIAPGSPPWIEILDTDRVGGGWVRLGRGGLPTDKLFSSDGVTPVQVKLYNTVPRDASTGALTTNPGAGGDLDLSLPRPLVYADAVLAVPQIGRYAATPVVSSFTTGAGSVVRTVGVLNVTTPGARGGLIELDNNNPAVTPGGGWSPSTVAASFKGSNYLESPITIDPLTTSVVTYAPALGNGEYNIFAWLPGSSNGESFGTSVEYRIYEGTALTTVYVDQDLSAGWVQLGSRKFRHSTAAGQALRVEATNFSNMAGDAGRKAYVDTLGFTTGDTTESVKAVVTSWDHATGLRRWRFSPLEESEAAFNMDNLSAGVTLNGAAWVSSTNVPNFRGSDHYAAPIVNDPLTASTVTYDPGSPTLEDGTYDIYVWLPGESGAEPHSATLVYEVHEGEDITPVTVNQVTVQGWVRIGTRRFEHSSVAPLRLVVTNYSADPGDIGDFAYTDAVRFVGTSNLAVGSTPVQQNALVRLTRGGVAEERGIVLVAAENGRLYCLDATGRGDGTTNILWTYPSTPDPDLGSAWLDPNLNPPDATNTDWAEIDGTANQRIAEMPTGFDLSSALIQRIGGVDYLFIASQNGRVYCLEVAGRGDFDAATGKPGTTRRMWSYPDDFPSAPKPSALGGFLASVSYAETGSGPTLFVPAEQGRLYALDAVGNPGTRTTTVRWAYPALTSPTLGPITTTPAIDFGMVYFGTSSKDGQAPGQFMALNADTGALNWEFLGTPAAPLDDFVGGPAIVDEVTLGGLMGSTVFVANNNRFVYALYAGDGSVTWATDELEAPARAPLVYTVMQVTNNSLLYEDRGVIIVPRTDGVISMLSARTSDVTLTNRRRARGDFFTESPSLTAGVAVGWNFMYYADNAGYLYARSAVGGIFPPDDYIPGGDGTGENEPGYGDYSNAQIKLIKKDAYISLRQGAMYYQDAIDPINAFPRNAFEWGETMYIMVYNFPYKVAGQTLPPTVALSFNVGGSTIRNIFAQAQKFPGFDAANPYADDHPQSGYAVAPFTLNGAGANALPPGPGIISANFNVVGSGGAPRVFSAQAPIQIYIAHPLALIIPNSGSTQSIGADTNPMNPQNLENGSGQVPDLLATGGAVGHGGTGKTQVEVIDRSVMTLLRGGGRGLSNVRITRPNLAWNSNGVVEKQIDGLLFPLFEDLPVNFPNTSLDYPDVARERVTVTKNASGETENPVFYGVELFAPTQLDGSPLTEATIDDRELIRTPFDFLIEVPKFQPANVAQNFNANGEALAAGYLGNYFIYVDSDGNGSFTRSGAWDETADGINPANTREAYRNFALGASVPVDERMSVTTPTLNLGNLSSGLGYTPALPGPLNPLFSPWDGAYEDIFKPFRVVNEGNVNMLNLRLAKATTTDDVVFNPWKIFSAANDDLTYLDGEWDLFSDLDPGFAPTRDLAPGVAPVIMQKSRVGDRAPRELSPNPVRRQNPNLGVVQDEALLDPNVYPLGPPRVAVTIPFGFPVGTYSGLVRVIEDNVPGDSDANSAMNLDAGGNATEPFTDPTLRVSYTVRESRSTGGISPFTAPFVDPPGPGPAPDTDLFRRQNRQPTALRSPDNGSLLVAWTSDRADWTQRVNPFTGTGPSYKIYIAGVNGETPLAAAGTSPLRDLNAFARPDPETQWFVLPVGDPKISNGFPGTDVTSAQVFNLGASDTLDEKTVQYGSPSFPTAGLLDPFRTPGGSSSPYAYGLLGFVGESQVRGADGSVRLQSKIFLAPVTIASDGRPEAGEIVAMTNDPGSVKGKPSVLQTNEGAVVFYAGTSGSQSRIYFTLFDGNSGSAEYTGARFTESKAVPLGQGFESSSAPSVTGRRYVGAGAPPLNLIEMSFSGKLRGRPNSEVFYARLDYQPGTPDPVALLDLPDRTNERLVSAGEAGVYRSMGVSWALDRAITLSMDRGGSIVSIEVPNTRRSDRSTGLVTFQTSLGGTAYLDPNLGTVRLANATVPRDGTLLLSYTPRIMRISETSSAGFVAPTLAVDERLIPEIGYWSKPDETAVTETDEVRAGRFLFMYNRAAAGSGQSARPFYKTMRFGIDLPTPVFTTPDGVVATADLTVTGESSFYQIDPAKGKVYFTTADEDRLVTINYRMADPATGKSLGMRQIQAVVGLISERNEAPMPLDQAVNESNLSMFLDPFEMAGTQRRPGLFWLFWTSNRSGAPDLFFQTMAPRFAPFPEGKS